MKTQRKVLVAVLVFFTLLAALAGWYLHRYPVSVVQPAGVIGHKERNLIIFTASISLVVVIPVFAMLIGFALRYREGNPRGRYSPDLAGSRVAETIWWLIPAIMIGMIGTITWRSSYALDPFRPLSGGKTEQVQVVALDWKWLFIYPDQHMASVNVAYIPANTPVDFQITSDAVMTSFWAPQLGGQMYAMPGMSTHLNLEANRMGMFNGSAANISGKGFADMTFRVVVLSSNQYAKQMQSLGTASSTGPLTASAYSNLAQPSVLHGNRFYRSVEPDLYDRIVLKYMTPVSAASNLGASL